MNFGSNSYSGSDRTIIRRRIAENKLAALQTAVQKNYHLGSIAKWEQSSSKLMSSKQQQRQQLEIEKKKKLDLEIRKSKLRSLLAEDEVLLKKEIDNKAETPQQKKERLQKRAMELKRKRIARREEFVAKQRLKQFREQCDELRLNAGKNLTMECDRIRKQQMEEQRLAKEYEKGVDDQYLKIWKNELQQKIDRESRESEHKKKLNDETAKAIQLQMKLLQDEREKEKQMKQSEIQERVRNLREHEDNQRLKSVQKLKDLEAKRTEMMQEYEMFKKRKENEAAAERQMDKEFITRVLNEEKAESKQKAHEQDKNKEDIQNYLAYLNELKQNEAENERLLEQLRAKELEKAWTKREETWKKEELARRQLLRNVVDGRKDQIAYKQNIKQKHSKQNVHETERMLKEFEVFNISEQKKVGERLRYNKEIQQFLTSQIEEKRKLDAENNKVEFDPDADKNREMYNKLLHQETERDRAALEQGKSGHHFPKTTANWYSY